MKKINKIICILLLLFTCFLLQGCDDEQTSYTLILILNIIFTLGTIVISFLPFAFAQLSFTENKSRKVSIITLIINIILCPFILMLTKPIHFIPMAFYTMLANNAIYPYINLKWFRLSSFYFYPTLTITANNFNFGWIIGLVISLVYVLVISKINGTIDFCDEAYNIDMKNVVHEKYTVVTDQPRYSVIRGRVVHNFETHTVDNTEYPTHLLLPHILCSLLAIIITPYTYFLTQIIINIVNIIRNK